MSMSMGGKGLDHSGFVGVVGRPNVGKSTLLNKLAERKIAIVSNKPQTTRHTIRAVINFEGAQIVMIDTPGFHKPKDGLGNRLNAKVRRTMAEVDVVLFLMDGAAGIGAGDAYLAKELRNVRTPIVTAVNKIDLMDEGAVAEAKRAAGGLVEGGAVYALSGANGTGLSEVLHELSERLPPGPKYYPDGVLTDQPEAVLIGELIREKLIEATREELPYAIAVEVTEVKRRRGRDLVDVYARIHVERSSQKGIIIGHQGSVLSEVGRRAREEIQGLLASPVYLDLMVKVSKSWRNKESKVEDLGY